MIRRAPLLTLLVLLLAATAASLLPAQASAVDFTARYSANARGDIVLRGNTSLQCPAAATGCQAARNGNGNKLDNNNYDMRYVDIDADPSTFNSSEASVQIPANATVARAYLYWAADTSVGNGTTGNPAPTPNQRNQVLLKTPTAAGYTRLFADTVYREDRNPSRFQSVEDVTALVQAAGNGQYRVANIQSSTGDYSWAGWSLVVVYTSPTEPVRNLTVFDGLAEIGEAGQLQTLNVNVNGFRTPNNGAVRGKVGTVIYDGDLSPNETGDSVRLNGTVLSNAVNPPNNYANSTISQDGSLLGGKNPNYRNQMGLDVDRLDTNNVLSNGQTSATFQFRTSKDVVLPGVFTFAFEQQAPQLDLTKSVSDINGGDVEPGDTLRYTVNAVNNGIDPATVVALADPIPENSTYAPGSLNIVSGPNAGPKTDPAGDDQGFYDATPGSESVVFFLGSGATSSVGGTLAVGQSTSVSFDVVVDPLATAGTRIENQAFSLYGGQSTPGFTYGAISNEVVNIVAEGDVDLTIDKEASEPNLAPGESFTYTLTPSNAGSDPSVGEITVSDVIPPSIEATSVAGAGWDCELVDFSGTIIAICTTSDVVAPGDPLPPITINARVRDSAPNGTIPNTGTVAGGGDTNLANNSDTANVDVAQNADVAVIKRASEARHRVGDRFNYTLDVTNNGPSTANNVIVTDTPPDAVRVLSVRTDKGSCSEEIYCELGTMARNESVEITVRVEARRDGRNVRNTATVAADEPDDNPDNNTSTVVVRIDPRDRPDPPRGGVDLSVEKTAKGEINKEGDRVTFKMVVRNLSRDRAATGVVLSDPLPKQVRAREGDAKDDYEGGDCRVTKEQVLRCEVDRLPPRAGFEVTVEAVVVDASEEIENVAKVKGDQRDPNPDNNTSTVIVFTPDGGDGGSTPPVSGGGTPTDDGGNLPFTGLPILPALIAALLLVGAGVGIKRRLS